MKNLPNLAICYIAMVKPWPIEIDGLPNLKMVIFHGYVKQPEGKLIQFWCF